MRHAETGVPERWPAPRRGRGDRAPTARSLRAGRLRVPGPGWSARSGGSGSSAPRPPPSPVLAPLGGAGAARRPLSRRDSFPVMWNSRRAMRQRRSQPAERGRHGDPAGSLANIPFRQFSARSVFPEFAGPQSVIHAWCEQRRRFAEERKRAGGSTWLLVASVASGSALLERGTLREIGLQTALRRPGTAMQRRQWPPLAVRLRWPR